MSINSIDISLLDYFSTSSLSRPSQGDSMS